MLGAIASWGRDVAGAGASRAATAARVAVVGGDVRVSGGIDSRPGRGVDNSAGPAGPIALAARGSLVVSGAVDASGRHLDERLRLERRAVTWRRRPLDAAR